MVIVFSCYLAGVMNRLVVFGGSATKLPAAARRAEAEKDQGSFSSKRTSQRRAGFELAFDGLNCTEHHVGLFILICTELGSVRLLKYGKEEHPNLSSHTESKQRNRPKLKGSIVLLQKAGQAS